MKNCALVLCLSFVLFISASGCAQSSSDTPAASRNTAPGSAQQPVAADALGRPAILAPIAEHALAPVEIPIDAAAPADVDANHEVRDPRRIIYQAQVELRVDSVAETAEKLEALVSESRGYVSTSDMNASEGRISRAIWKIRIPSGSFRNFLIAASEFGELVRQTSSSQEVTAEFIDIDARLKGRKRQEERLQSRLSRATTSEEITRLEEELTRIQTDMELIQGRLNLLHDQTTFSTVDVTMTEITAFSPPVVLEEPDFSTQVSRAYEQSVKNLSRFGTAFTTAAITFGPWLLILSVPFWLLWRFFSKRMTRPRLPAVSGRATT